MTLHPEILAGGSGTRLWPLSRHHLPKQFLPLTGPHSLFQEALLRLEGMDNVAEPIVVCGQSHQALALEQMEALGKKPNLTILEPQGRNTAPALTMAALALDAEPPDTILLAMPADHVIQDVVAFQQSLRTGLLLAQQGYLVTFGVSPTRPETGYGYIRRGDALAPSQTEGPIPHRADAFAEKPDDAKAQDYVNSGYYFWNSGIFMMAASVWLAELERHRPDILVACRAVYASSHRQGPLRPLDKDAFAACPRESIDYAVMEPSAGQNLTKGSSARGCAVVPLDAGWSDLGSWKALWEVRKADALGNVVEGDVRTARVKNSLLLSQGRTIAVVGLEDVVIVETSDAILVASKDKAQELRDLVERLAREDVK